MNRSWMPALAGLMVTGACGDGTDPNPEVDAAVDAADASADAAPVFRWTAAEPIAELATPGDERYPSLTDGDRVIYFTRTEMIGSFTVNVPYSAYRASTELPFGAAVRPVAWGASSIFDQEHAGDHLEWFFWRGLGQLGTAARASIGDPWSFPSDIGVDGFSPSISGDGRSLYFVDFSGELAVMTRDGRGSPWSTPAIIPVAGDLEIEDVDVSADELTLVIATDPAGDAPGLYLASRASIADGFSEPEPIGALSGPYESPRFNAAATEIVCGLQLGGDRNLYRSRLVAE